MKASTKGLAFAPPSLQLAMCGSHPPPFATIVADAAAGALLGVGAAAAVGALAPAIAAAFGPRCKARVCQPDLLRPRITSASPFSAIHFKDGCSSNHRSCCEADHLGIIQQLFYLLCCQLP
jgi:hypothetical protein